VVSPEQEAEGQEHGELDSDNEAAYAAFSCRFIEAFILELGMGFAFPLPHCLPHTDAASSADASQCRTT